VGKHANLLAELAQNRIFSAFAGMPSAAGKPPARRVAELDQDQIALGRQRVGMRAEGARPANEPAEAEQPVRRRKRQAQCSVD